MAVERGKRREKMRRRVSMGFSGGDGKRREERSGKKTGFYGMDD
jgi:hypothetical protein